MSYYKPYLTYEDSGVEWIGLVPAHWDLKPICQIASVNDNVLPESIAGDVSIRYVDISSVGYMDGIKQATEIKFSDAPSRARRKAVSGDVIVSTVRTYLKAVAAVTDEYADCVFSTGFAVLRARKLDQSFLKWAILSELLVQAIEAHSEGLSYPAINASTLAKLKVAVPPPEEQSLIAKVLDQETARIDTLIAKKTRFIELLKEKRQAVITKAVTKGLDDSVEMKDSGEEWIGRIPASWVSCRIKDVAESIIGLTYSPTDIVTDESGTPVLRSSNIQDGDLDMNDLVRVKAAIPSRLYVKNGDILVCARNGSRALIGKNIQIDDRAAGCAFGAFMTVVRSKYSDFLYYIFNSSMFDAQSGLFMTSTVNQLTISMINNMKIALPPEDEQAMIVERLKNITKRIDRLIQRTQRSIELLKEKRSALITAAVTGKIDVREAA